ncbi:C6 transcriptional factor [Mycena chlorophos]|uniref:C6 transcriptional factor n=1 Tax=Mycena chlorophos TaxID=658473 RepID=A0A8H6TT35_MYCCL|nr:C6 transcriptional factor [Mycena chlorophos]
MYPHQQPATTHQRQSSSSSETPRFSTLFQQWDVVPTTSGHSASNSSSDEIDSLASSPVSRRGSDFGISGAAGAVGKIESELGSETIGSELDDSSATRNAYVFGARQRTTQACDKCRDRKTKCSGDHPVCKRCNSRGLICHYSGRELGRARGTAKARLRNAMSSPSLDTQFGLGGGEEIGFAAGAKQEDFYSPSAGEVGQELPFDHGAGLFPTAPQMRYAQHQQTLSHDGVPSYTTAHLPIRGRPTLARISLPHMLQHQSHANPHSPSHRRLVLAQPHGTNPANPYQGYDAASFVGQHPQLQDPFVRRVQSHSLLRGRPALSLDLSPMRPGPGQARTIDLNDVRRGSFGSPMSEPPLSATSSYFQHNNAVLEQPQPRQMSLHLARHSYSQLSTAATPMDASLSASVAFRQPRYFDGDTNAYSPFNAGPSQSRWGASSSLAPYKFPADSDRHTVPPVPHNNSVLSFANPWAASASASTSHELEPVPTPLGVQTEVEVVCPSPVTPIPNSLMGAMGDVPIPPRLRSTAAVSTPTAPLSNETDIMEVDAGVGSDTGAALEMLSSPIDGQ